MREALDFGLGIGEMVRTEGARKLWKTQYDDLTREHPGQLGAVTARGAAQVTRLSVIYALLDRKAEIGAEHLEAGLALWDYVRDSARFIFGDSLGDRTADRILGALRGSGDGGLTRTEISDLFGRNRDSREIERALVLLQSLGLAESARQASGGRDAEYWKVTR